MDRKTTERLVIGSLLRYPQLIETYRLIPSSFLHDGALYQAMLSAEPDEAGTLPADTVATLAGISSAEVLSFPVAPNLEAAKDRIGRFRQLLLREGVVEELKAIIATKGERDQGVEILGKLGDLIERYRSIDDDASLPTLESTLIELCEERVKMSDVKTKLSTGIKHLDHLIGGIIPGEAVVIAARPGNGKTTFAMQLTRLWAEEGLTGVYYTAEMTRSALAERVAHAIVHRPVFTGDLTRTEWGIVRERVEASMQRIKLADVSVIHTSDIRRHLYNEVERGAGFFVIDNLKHVDRDSKDRDLDRLARAIRDLRAVAKEWRVPVIVLHHLSRRAEYAESDDERSLGWLKACGDIEEEADTVIFMEADDAEGFDGMDVLAEAGFWVMKARRTGFRNIKVPVVFDKRRQMYLAQEQDDVRRTA